jgi:iron complex outermembrane recepter protein
MKASSWGSVFLCLTLLSGVAQARAPEQPIQIELGQQPLADALNEFARQANISIVFFSDVAREITSKPLSGSYTVQGALNVLLAGVPLQYRFADARTLEIHSLSIDRSRSHTRAGSKDTAANESRPQEITITGSRIRGIPDDALPMTVYNRADIDRTGARTLEEFMRTVQQNFGLISPTTFFNSGGNTQAGANSARGAAFDLHGLGSGSTLVLVDGRRLAPAGVDGSFVDISLLPLSAIDRIDVLTDGTSAVYGADAIAGVVYIRLRRDFEGAQTSLHFSQPTRGGAEGGGASQILGKSWNGGNVTVVYEYDRQLALDATQRRFAPPHPAAFTIVPEQVRNRAVLNVRHNPTAALELFGEAYYSERNFGQNAVTGPFSSSSIGAARQVDGAGGFRYRLGEDWSSELLAHYSEYQSHTSTVSIFLGTGTPRLDQIAQRSQLSSASVRADGPIFPAPGGEVRASTGAEWRREEFDDLSPLFSAGRGLQRDVLSTYAEVFVPLVGALNPRRGLQRLEFSLAARYDDYDNLTADDFNSFDPKLSVLWAPTPSLRFRGSYAKSFRAPPLTRFSSGTNAASLENLVNPSSPGGTNTLLLFGGNRALKPEQSRSFTIGLDIEPAVAPGLSIAATYFNIDYTDRIAVPLPIQGSPRDIFRQAEFLASFIDASPSGAQIEDIYARYNVLDPSGIGKGGVEAIFDGRYQNIGSIKAVGMELSASYKRSIAHGTFDFFLVADHLHRLDAEAVPTIPAVALVDRPYNPPSRRWRTGANFQRASFASFVALNVNDSGRRALGDGEIPQQAWVTVDAQVTYTTSSRNADRRSGNLTIALTIQNLADRDPPLLESSDLAYDATNSSALGRVVTGQITKSW